MDSAILKLLKDRYFLESESSWDDVARRVSSIYEDSYSDIRDMAFIPSTPTLMNANTQGKRLGTLSSCFIMDVEDSIESIFDSLKEAALVTKAAGGVGYVFSKLRASNENINSLGANSSGPIPFMNIFNSTLDGIRQGGKRRGAGMAQFDITHPDILTVIRSKEKEGFLERFNISLRINEDFYNKLENNPNEIHLVRDSKGNEFKLKDGNKEITVLELWNEIIDKAWKSGEPGIFNSDIAYKQCTSTNLNSTVSSNPCAEYVNIPYSSCNLGSINLTAFLNKDKEFDWNALESVIRRSTRFLNNVIDINSYPIQKIKEITQLIRPIGLGCFGFGHALFLLEIPYNSKQALEFADKLSMFLTTISIDESIEIAKETSKSYPSFDYNLYMKANERFFKDGKNKELKEKIKKYGIANSCNTSIAPTGSISFIAGKLSGGIEPIFALAYSRKIEKENKEYDVVYIVDHIFENYLELNFDKKTKENILKKITDNNGSCQNVEEIPEKYKKVFVTAGDLTPMEHLISLATFTKNISLSTSKTINLPFNATREDISKVYKEAYKLGIIGVTVYRDGCRAGILNTSKETENYCIVDNNAPKRPKKLTAHLFPVTVKGHKFGVAVGLLNNRPYEVFAFIKDGADIKHCNGELIKQSKGRYDFVSEEYKFENIHLQGEAERAVTIMASQLLRHGVQIKHIIHTIKKISDGITDFTTAIARVLSKYIEAGEESVDNCPECGAKLVYENGCVSCKQCGFSKCA